MGSCRLKRYLRLKRPGMALVLVLWVLIFLSGVALEFGRTMRMEVNMTRNFNEASRSHYLARAGVQTAIYELIKNEYGAGATAAAPQESIWRANADIPELAYGEGAFKIRLDNASGWININTADRSLLSMMLDALHVDEKDKDIIIDSILDWRDADDLHRTNGAEDDYYRSLPQPYECKDGDFDSVDELLFVRGITPALFYGGLNQMVMAISDDRKQLQDLRSAFRRRQRSVTQSRINVNAAPTRLLAALPGMTVELAEKINQYRQTRDFAALHELSDVVGVEAYNAITPYITLDNSPYYTIRALGRPTAGTARSGVEAVVKIDVREPDGFRILEWKDALY